MRASRRSVLVIVVLLAVSYAGGGLTAGGKAGEPPPGAYTRYWGDLHAHTAYSNDAYDLGNETLEPEDAIAYARDTAGLDFVAITDHAEFTNYDNAGHGNFGDEWQNMIVQVNAANTSTFAAFIGFEFTKAGVTPEGSYVGGGHKCVIFRDGRVPAAPIPAFDPATGAPTIGPRELWSQLDAGGYDYMTIPHHPAKGKAAWYSFEDDMRTDWDFVNQSRQRVVEVYSVHGNSEVAGNEEPVDPVVDANSVEEALKRWLTTGERGYQVGIVGSTDNHQSKPGSVEERAENVVLAEGHYTGGLTAVLATGLTRGEIFDAIKARRTYATSGPRIGLDFTATVGSRSYLQGESIRSTGPATVSLSVTATGDTANIDTIVVIRNGVEFARVENLNLATATWTGNDTVSGRACYRVKIYQRKTRRWDDGVNPETWHAERAWSSPIWVDVAPPPAEFDGDLKADPAVYRPSSGTWFHLKSSTSNAEFGYRGWGVDAQGDVPAPGDFDGDGIVDPAVFRASVGSWFILKSSAAFADWTYFGWGTVGDQLVQADYDNDGATDAAVFRPSTGQWFVRPTANPAAAWSVTFGATGDVPVPADYDGDGKADIAVYRASAGTWFVLTSSSGFTRWTYRGWGVQAQGDVPVPGDYDGDGKADLAVFRPGGGTWFVLESSTDNAEWMYFGWGVATDVLVPADYDADGTTDAAIYRPSTGQWFVRPSTAPSSAWNMIFGASGDQPITGKIR